MKSESMEADIEHQQEMEDLSKDFERQSRITEKRMAIDLKKERKQINDKIKKAVLDKFKHKCRDCSEVNEEMLEIHHIDMDNEHTYLSNLIPLCPDCHIKKHKTESLKKYYSTGLMRKRVKEKPIE